MDKKYFFRDVWSQRIFILLSVYLVIAYINYWIQILSHPGSHAVRFDWPTFTFGVLIVGNITYACLRLRNEGVRLRKDAIEFTNLLGRATKSIRYEHIESFRVDGYEDQGRYFALVSEREKIRIPTSMPKFKELAQEIRLRHYGGNVPARYPEFIASGQRRGFEEVIEW